MITNAHPVSDSTRADGLAVGLANSHADSQTGGLPDWSFRLDIRENRYAGWKILSHDVSVSYDNGFAYQLKDNGSAFGNEPARGAFPGQEPVSGYQGQRLVNTRRRNLGALVGELRSDPFVITGDRIDFLIGGGAFGLPSSLNLLLVGENGATERVCEATGNNSSCLERQSWDVSAWKGKMAVLQIIDDVSIEPFGTPSWPEDPYGFILVDDIRQTDEQGVPVDPAGDRARNFDFETVLDPSLTVVREIQAAWPHLAETLTLTEAGSVAGVLKHEVKCIRIDDHLQRFDHTWQYHGQPVVGVKFELVHSMPVAADTCQYYVIPGLLYHGNDIGDRSHYLGEDMPEDAATLPSGYSVEDADHVYGGWAVPQKGADDPMSSVRLEQDHLHDSWIAVFSLPYSAQFSRKYNLDADVRLTLTDGFCLHKQFFVYQAPKQVFTWISNQKSGYGQVLQAAWQQLYPLAPTNPPHSLSEDYAIKMNALLDPLCLMQDVAMPDRTYRIWWVGRWLLGNDFPFDQELVPLEYFHRYTGFSWSGMLEIACYNGFKAYLGSGSPVALQVSLDTMDFFANHGMSPSGILYPAYYATDFFSSQAGFGSFWAKPHEIDIAHLAEGLNMYVRCHDLLKERGIADRSRWLDIVASSLDAIMQMFPDGDVPGRFNAVTGEPAFRPVGALYWNDSVYARAQWRQSSVRYDKPSQGGATGICFLIWPYVRWYLKTGRVQYLDYAEKMGQLTLEILHRYGRLCGMEVDYFNIDKRMGHGALAAFNDLYEATGHPRWLEAAVQAGNWFATWQYAFNVDFSAQPGTPLQVFDYRTIGGTPVDIKYSSNNTCFQQGATEFMRLWQHTKDPVWFERARTLLHQGLQNTLTEEKRQWLNSHYQGPAHKIIADFNPTSTLTAMSWAAAQKMSSVPGHSKATGPRGIQALFRSICWHRVLTVMICWQPSAA